MAVRCKLRQAIPGYLLFEIPLSALLRQSASYLFFLKNFLRVLKEYSCFSRIVFDFFTNIADAGNEFVKFEIIIKPIVIDLINAIDDLA